MQSMMLAAYVTVALWVSQTPTIENKPFHAWAPTPPMGWNSWDCFGATVTEEQTKANADYMAEHLARHGWQYIVVDIQWYEPQSKGWDYARNPKPVLDEYGRLWPVVAKFPSSADGKGFKPLADYVHAKGLKFGVHLMRGIPREAVKRDCRVLGTDVTASAIANTASTCPWNPDMYGVDMSKPGAQAYYDSVFKLLASWDIDYVKVDDLSRPYHPQKPEVEAIRKAIDACGRPIVLSTSPGATPFEVADHVATHANLWRLTDDFWDSWPLLKQEFAICDRWSPYIGPGHWPDPDMLPLGAIHVGPQMNKGWTKFTRDEQVTLMTLFCMVRAPLMFGGHLPWNDEHTLSLITNDEVLAVDQRSLNNRQLFRQDDLVGWVADVPDSPDKYLALFNARDAGDGFDHSKALFTSGILRGRSNRSVEVTADIRGASKLFLVVSTTPDGFDNDHADWLEPRLIGPGGEKKLTDLQWVTATAGWGQAAVGKNASGQDLIWDGKPVAFGIGTHAPSVIEYDLPAGYETFEATGALDAGSRGRGSVQLFVYSDKAVVPVPENATVTASLADAGFTGPVRIRDLWSHQDLGVFEKEFSRDIAFHGAGLYRVSPAQMPLKVAFEGRVSEHKWPLKELDAQLPSDWSDYQFLVLELKTSTPQRFSLWLHTAEGKRRIMFQPFGQNVWLRASIPLQYFKGKDQKGVDLASTNNRRMNSFWMGVWGPFGQLKNVEALSVAMDYPLNSPTLEIRSIRLAKEDAGSEFVVDGPVVDEFGQWAHADWPRKIKSREQLEREMAEEQKSLAGGDEFGYCPYGGYKNTQARATGFFRVERIDGRWWFVDPDGHLFLSTGADCIGPARSRTGDQAGGAALIYQRMDAWGMNTVGNWSSLRPTDDGRRKAYVVSFRGPRVQTMYLGMPDVYSEEFARGIDQAAATQCPQYRSDPWLLGYFLGNEPPWEGRESEMVDMFLKGPATATQARLKEYLAQGDTPKRREEFVHAMFERYLTLMGDAIKKHDPNHLNLGIRFGGAPAPAVMKMGRAFDVCSINVYEYEPTKQLKALYEATGRPLLIGEFHFGVPADGLGAGLVQTANQIERAKGYRYYMEQAAALPGFLGAHWFQWSDQPVLGRMDGENYNIGLVDVTNRPYPEMVEALKTTHKRLHDVHGGTLAPFAERPKASQAGTLDSPWRIPTGD